MAPTYKTRLHATLWRPHSSFWRPHSVPHIQHSVFYIPHSGAHIPHSGAHIPHSGAHVPHSGDHVPHCGPSYLTVALHTTMWRPHTTMWAPPNRVPLQLDVCHVAVPTSSALLVGVPEYLTRDTLQLLLTTPAGIGPPTQVACLLYCFVLVCHECQVIGTDSKT